MIYLFWALIIIGSLYFGLAKRRFDFFSLAFFSACIYFAPGLTGFVLYPTGDFSNSILVSISPPTYWVMLVVISGLVLTGLITDYFQLAQHTRIAIPHGNTSSFILCLFSLIFCLLSIFTSGPSIFNSDKIIVLASLSRWQVLATLCAICASILAFSCRNWLALILSLSVLVFDWYIGIRMNITIAVVGIALVHLSKGDKKRLFFKEWRTLIAGVLFAAFICLSPSLTVFLHSKQLPMESVFSTDTVIYNISHAEPFLTQAILDRVLKEDFRIPPQTVLYSLGSFIPFYTLIAPPPVSYNDLFQPMLFPTVRRYGLANNFWAEAYSVGGEVGLLLFLLLFLSFLGFGNIFLNSDSPAARGFGVSIFGVWAFYIHRNDLLFQFNLERNLILICFLAAATAYLFHWIFGFFSKPGTDFFTHRNDSC